MKLSLQADVNPPSWLMPAAHTLVGGAGLAYVQLADQPPIVTTAVVFLMGVSYGRILNLRAARKTAADHADHA